MNTENQDAISVSLRTAQAVVITITTTADATGHTKVDIMITLGFQWMNRCASGSFTENRELAFSTLAFSILACTADWCNVCIARLGSGLDPGRITMLALKTLRNRRTSLRLLLSVKTQCHHHYQCRLHRGLILYGLGHIITLLTGIYTWHICIYLYMYI